MADPTPQQLAKALTPYSFGKRHRQTLHPGEDSFFQSNPLTTGMAAEDGRVILNPYSALSQGEQGAVYQNELSRILMKERNVRPNFDVRPDQAQQFRGTAYENNMPAMRETLAARLVSNDPSAGAPTGDQKAFAESLLRMLRDFDAQN